MAQGTKLRVLFFDVFGTCVAQRPSVGEELWKAAQEALNSDESKIDSDVRSKATKMTYDDWFDFGGEWNRTESVFVQESIEKTGNVDYREVDKNRIATLPKLLAQCGLVLPSPNAENSTTKVGEGSLWDDSQLEHLGKVWHRLNPWPDTCAGMQLLNKRFSTAALSNTYSDLLEGLIAYSGIPFTKLFSADMFESYKPQPKVYLSAAEKMGVKPEECALVAAHLGDLKAAKACGFYAISVVRPLEEKQPELKKENIPDLVIEEEENGFLALAKRLGIQAD